MSPTDGTPLGPAFLANWLAIEGPGPDRTVVVAVSGGVDSLVLLHLLRFRLEQRCRPRLHIAHFDHAMRPDSAGDAAWVRGLSRAWDVPFTGGRAWAELGSEEQAREARYAFLQRVREETAADCVLTAHHADDQAETVLFRILRGTGLRGLAGIAEKRQDRVLRPLLPFWKSQILGYARRHGIQPRVDPTNRDRSLARNRIRHDVLPLLEREAGTGIRRALVRLAGIANENERAWSAVLGELLERMEAEARGDRVSFARGELLAYDPGVRARVLRDLARRLGGRLDAAGTGAALAFSERGRSGRTLRLPGGLRLSRSFDRLTLSVSTFGGSNVPLRIPGPESGSGELVVGGCRFDVRWSRNDKPEGRWRAAFETAALGFPLHFREWRPGDRMDMGYGSKKVTRLFAEARIAVDDRPRRAVLADSRGRVLWVPGIARSSLAGSSDGDIHFALGIADAHDT